MSQQEYRDDEDVQTAVRHLFLGCAPERKEELTKLWQQFGPKFQIAGPIHFGDRIVMEAGAFEKGARPLWD